MTSYWIAECIDCAATYEAEGLAEGFAWVEEHEASVEHICRIRERTRLTLVDGSEEVGGEWAALFPGGRKVWRRGK